MKSLLEAEFGGLYKARYTWHKADVKTREGAFSLVDDNACRKCSTFFRNNCGLETFLLQSECAVNVLNIEAFLNGFYDIEGERCDLLLYDDDNEKIALADMYCGMSEYLNKHLLLGGEVMGKTEKARNQIESTLSKLFSFTEIAGRINAVAKKYGIFAYREKDKDLFVDLPEVVQTSKDAFLGMFNDQKVRPMASPMSYGFSFVTVPYPDRYIW